MTKTHGVTGYGGGCRCDTCREAKREQGIADRALGAVPDGGTHGHGGYSNYNCRCDVCVGAYLLYQHRAKKKQAKTATCSECATPMDRGRGRGPKGIRCQQCYLLYRQEMAARKRPEPLRLEEQITQAAALLRRHGFIVEESGGVEAELTSPLWTRAEVSAYLRCTQVHVKHLHYIGKLVAVSDGYRLLWRRRDVEGYAESLAYAREAEDRARARREADRHAQEMARVEALGASRWTPGRLGVTSTGRPVADRSTYPPDLWRELPDGRWMSPTGRRYGPDTLAVQRVRAKLASLVSA